MTEQEISNQATAQQIARQLAISYRMTFNSEHGERVLEHLRYLGFDTQVAYQYQMSPMDLAFREGRRSLVKEIERQLAEPLGIEPQPTASEEGE